MLFVGIKLMDNWEYDSLGFSLMGFSLISLLLIFMLGIAAYVDSNDFVARYSIIQETIDTARNNEQALERVSMQQEVIAINSDLVSWQYWNSNIFADIFITDDVKHLQRLE